MAASGAAGGRRGGISFTPDADLQSTGRFYVRWRFVRQIHNRSLNVRGLFDTSLR